MVSESGLVWNTPQAWKALEMLPDDTGMPMNFSCRLQVNWSFGGKPPKGGMRIAPADPAIYEHWLPMPAGRQAGPDYGPAEPLEFQAEILPDKPGEAAPKGRIHFRLRNLSRNQGVCTNFPLNGGDEDDLRFVPGQAGIKVDPADPRHAYTEKEVTEATVKVEATDTGAYGTIQADCDDLNLLAEYERTGGQSVALPMDDNGNHVGDAWERERGVYERNYPADWDEDPYPAGQRRPGDGYTLFEEYRGFVTRGGFVRTDPGRKDLFVHDPDELVKTYYEPYNPAQLILHYIDPTMMKFSGEAKNPENRWVNYNSPRDLWYARQYAVFLKQWTTMSDGTVGEAYWLTLADLINGITDQYEGFKEPLKSIYIIKISPAVIERSVRGIANPERRQYLYRMRMISAVIHEFGHGLGIHHHAEGGVENLATASSGVFGCAMRYETDAESEHPELFQAVTQYCRKGETWKRPIERTDKNGNKTFAFETVPAHDCFGQIEIKSDP